MTGDRALGAVLKALRKSSGLTIAAAARLAHCSLGQLSSVENGKRTLHGWLAHRLDALYGTGGVIADLLNPGLATDDHDRCGVSPDHLLRVRLPGGGAPMVVSRRQVLAALGVGVLADPAVIAFERAVARLDPSPERLADYASEFDVYQVAARTMAPSGLIDAMTGRVAVLDLLRRRTTGKLRTGYLMLQARYAESLSWLSEEDGRDSEALYWIDRAGEWAQACGWAAMTGYTYVRRSMVAITFTHHPADAGARAVDYATTALTLPGTPSRIKGLAAKQASFGFALASDADNSARALDSAMDLLAAPDDDGSELGQRSVASDDLYQIFQATRGVYLGGGETAIEVLRPRLDGLASSSARTAAITTAKLAHAYANLGQPQEAAALAAGALDSSLTLRSLSTVNAVRGAARVLQQWHRRPDVADVLHRVRRGDASPA